MHDVNWKAVEVPHDWLIYDTKNLYKSGEGWYLKKFTPEESERTVIRFEGIYMDSTIYLNGKQVGEWKYGYSTFEFDITEHIISGENEIMVRVVHESPNSRWYSGAGIYRNVWIKYTNADCIESYGVYVSPQKQKDGRWIVDIDTELLIQSSGQYSLKHSLIDASGDVIGVTESETKEKENYQKLEVINPKLWNLEDTNIYTMRTELYKDGILKSKYDNNFGFREISMTPDGGFKLNGKRMKLYGVCQHHDLGCLGAAVNKVALRRQIEILKEMGVNAIRTAHNMPAVELMELADEMGILICSESFDVWESPKTKYDYARFFQDWHERDVASWVRRDRNHPSLIMWCIGNEIYDTHAGERGQEVTKILKALVEKHDPKGHAPVTIGSNYMPWENAQKCADIVKLAGYNYADKYYADHHEKNPDWIIYGSETASTVQSRGIYHFPLEQSLLADDDEQCSALGNSSTSWGAKSTEACIIADRDAEFSLGQFLWSGFDYIGEPTPYHTKNSYLGQIDTAGFKKDSFYMYQAEWTDYKIRPMVHILPYWDFSENQTIDVRVCSNAPKVELFFNDDSLGTFDIDHRNGEKLLGDWKIRYKKGTLRAVAYDENGNVIAEDIRKSFGDATELVLNPDKSELSGTQDLIFVEIATVDKEGTTVENANNRVYVKVTGEGRLVGLDNGDSTDYDQYKGTSRRLFSGKLLAVIAGTNTSGKIYLEVESEGMATKCIRLQNKGCDIQKGVSTTMISNVESEKAIDIPVRKIELISSEGYELNENRKSITVQANIYPKNASNKNLAWRITDSSGIDSNIASITVDGEKAVVTAHGDGLVYLRCMSVEHVDGVEKVKLISQLDFTIEGLGEAYLDPYGFISGGLYNASNIELTNGNERGVATARELVSHVGFRDVDFGEIGSDTITLPIFSLSGEEFPIEIWEGMPDEPNSENICTVTYKSGSKWNTYIEETYTLPRKLKGITTICFVLQKKVHIKGFSFKKLEKAYESLLVTDYSALYGDSFVIKEGSVEGIGNNVSIVFNDMNFVEGLTKLQICGRTPLEKNMIKINFNGEHGEVDQIVEFSKSTEYDIQEFDLERVVGKNNITFIFLPGCNFDFKSFKFI